MFKVQRCLAALGIMFSLSSFALAQWGMPDFSQMDLSTYMEGQYTMTTQMIDQSMYGIMQQRGPEIQAAYAQCVQAGYYCGSFEDYALNYVSTNGFSDGGAWAATQQGMQAKEYATWQGVQQAEGASAAAINGWNNNYYENQGEMGNVLMGNSSWTHPNSGATYTLPQTWQADSYNTYNGYTYYVDPSGYYYQVDPNNTGWMYQLNPWQAGQ